MARKKSQDFTAWLDTGLMPEKRLALFHKWLRCRLAERLRWSLNPTKAAKELGQAEAIVRRVVRDLNQRGWLFDGEQLQEIIETKLNDIRKHQKQGSIRNLYIYFKASWERYVALHAESLSDLAKTMGYHIAPSYNQRIRGLRTIPSLEAKVYEERMSERVARERKALAAKEADESQMELF